MVVGSQATVARCSHHHKVLIPVRLHFGSLQCVALAKESFEIGRGFEGLSSLLVSGAVAASVSVELAFVYVGLIIHDT